MHLAMGYRWLRQTFAYVYRLRIVLREMQIELITLCASIKME